MFDVAEVLDHDGQSAALDVAWGRQDALQGGAISHFSYNHQVSIFIHYSYICTDKNILYPHGSYDALDTKNSNW